MVTITIPVDAYKRLADWASLSRTMDEVQRQVSDVAAAEVEALRKSLCDIHDAIRNHYIKLEEYDRMTKTTRVL